MWQGNGNTASTNIEIASPWLKTTQTTKKKKNQFWIRNLSNWERKLTIGRNEKLLQLVLRWVLAMLLAWGRVRSVIKPQTCVLIAIYIASQLIHNTTSNRNFLILKSVKTWILKNHKNYYRKNYKINSEKVK